MHNLKIALLMVGFVLAALFVSAQPALALEIQDMRFGHHGASVRVVMDMSAESDFRAMAQDNPQRIVIDTPMLSGKPAIRKSVLPALISDIRMEPLDGANTRMTLMLENPAVIRSAFMMPPEGPRPARLVVDLAPVDAPNFAKAVGKPFGTLVMGATETGKLPFAQVGGANLKPITSPKTPVTPTINDPKITAPTVDAPKSPSTLPLIMIDAGHGGIDPGATQGPVREKDITLAVAKALRTALQAYGKYRVQLTRDTDTFIRLPERVNIARRAGAALFVSIHADSAPEAGSSAHGASVYTLSDKSSDEQTARLAARENEVDLLGGVNVPSNDHEVAAILVDLAMRETTGMSRRFAGSLVAAFNHNGVATLTPAHKYAGFVVLKAPDIPSVLIELGFLSNPDEVKKLTDEKYRATLGKTIAAGIDDWFKTRKP